MPVIQLDPHTMVVSDVADAAKLSPTRVKQLDHLFKPIRGRNGHRRYNPAVVAQAIAERAAK